MQTDAEAGAEDRTFVKAWWAYWLTLTVGAALWIGVAVVGGREGIRTALGQPLWAVILLAPIFLAGLNLVGRGFSARTFALVGFVLLVPRGLDRVGRQRQSVMRAACGHAVSRCRHR